MLLAVAVYDLYSKLTKSIRGSLNFDFRNTFKNHSNRGHDSQYYGNYISRLANIDGPSPSLRSS